MSSIRAMSGFVLLQIPLFILNEKIEHVYQGDKNV